MYIVQDFHFTVVVSHGGESCIAVCCGKGVVSIKEYGWVQMGVTYMTPCLVLTAQRTKKADGNKRVRQT